jgi:very-short-patch-repair endonuclease
VFTSRGGPGEGVKTVKAERSQRFRRHRSLARRRAQIARLRDLRQNETECEKAAWRLLRQLRLKGFRFRRQHPLGQYIVDFCCCERRLIVELDGSVHAQPSQAKRDTTRDAQLRRMGYKLARFPNGMVLEAPELFVEKVLDMAWSQPDES